jgi:hypothetical protein
MPALFRGCGLELRAEPSELAQADDGASECCQSVVEVNATSVADSQTPNWFSHAKVRSTSKLLGPGRRCSRSPTRRREGQPHAHGTHSSSGDGLGLVGVQLDRPCGVARTFGTAASVGKSVRLSWQLAPFSVRPSEVYLGPYPWRL